jgi:pSer/pThr/pTyr-binding forkhead associated (FHA) protein
MSSQTIAAPMSGDQTNHNHMQFADRDALRLSIPQSESAIFPHDTMASTTNTNDATHAHPAPPPDDADHNESLKQLLDRLKRVSELQKEHGEVAPATQHVLEHHTPEAPSPSPLGSSNPSSRPSTARLIDDAETAGLSQRNLRALQSLVSGLGHPNAASTAENIRKLGLNDSTAHADLLADFVMQSHQMAGSTFMQLAPQREMDGMLEDAALELGEPTKDHLQKAHDAGRIEAFAKIDFADGYFYMTTASLELGRDELAFKSAQEKAKKQEERQQRSRPSSSSGNASNKLVRRAAGSQVQGSVVSERGGFCGVDPKSAEEQDDQEVDPIRSHSSQVSASSVVKMEDLELNPPPKFDYSARMQEVYEADNERPAPVTADHLPKPDSNPLIPIHPVTDNGLRRLDVHAEIEAHKSISRRHARIAWDDSRQCFVLEVLGRNGVFLNQAYMQRGQLAPLAHNSLIEISGIQMHFRLPPSQADSSDDSGNEEESSPHRANKQSTTPTSDGGARSLSPSRRQGAKTLLDTKATKKPELVSFPPRVGPDGQPLPPKKRGPGRPPKDGIMSNRERRELVKAQKAAAAKEANGGVTPPPSGRTGASRPSITDAQLEQAKLEKRKYTKRKREDGEEDGDIMPSIEGGQVSVPNDEEVRPPKKTRASRSPSPIYPPMSELSPEQLAKPQENYARLIYDVLSEIHPKGLGLRQIYRKLKVKYPYFVHGVTTDGWQSSVRHNLNSEHEKLFTKGDKDGKGFSWIAIPGKFTETKEDIAKKRKAQEAAQAEAKARAAQKAQYPYGPHQNWHGQPMQPFRPPPGLQPNGQPYPPYYNQNPQYAPGPNGMQWHQPPQGGPVRPQQPLLQPNPNGPGFPLTQNGIRPGGSLSNGTNAQNVGGFNQQSRLQQNLASILPHIDQGPMRPGSAGPMPPAAPRTQAPTSRFLPSNMPCSLEGIQSIQLLKTQVIKRASPERQAFMNAIFESARGRVMHGWPASTMPEGEQNLVEETVMMEMIDNVVKQFANPNYIRPNARIATPRATPKPEKADQGNGGAEDTEMIDVNGQAHVQHGEHGEGDKMQIDAQGQTAETSELELGMSG